MVGLDDEKILLGSLVQNLFWMEEEVPRGISPRLWVPRVIA